MIHHFAASTMDGYAVVAFDDGSPWREVLGVQKAGAVLDVEVTDGMAVKIMTGAPFLPARMPWFRWKTLKPPTTTSSFIRMVRSGWTQYPANRR